MKIKRIPERHSYKVSMTITEVLLCILVIAVLAISVILACKSIINTNKKTVAVTTVINHNINLLKLECYEQQI